MSRAVADACEPSGPDRAPLAWVLNLDAELELARGPGHRLPDALRARLEAAQRRLAATLPAGDVVLDLDPRARCRGREGRAWCPTPSALARLAAAGAEPQPAPELAILRRVNERGFSHALEHLPGALRATTEREAIEALIRPGRWLLQRELTFAGRGQRRAGSARRGAPSEPDRSWIRASLRQGAVYVQPRVDVLLEVAMHGELSSRGRLRRGRPTVQEVDPDGQWRGSRLAGPAELTASELEALGGALDRAADALAREGYHGPFGIDAFRYRGHHRQPDEVSFHPLSEINARYSMGWPVGMGGWG